MQRVVLLSYDAASNRIAFRHYGVSAQPSGVSRGVKTLVARRQLPDMGGLADVAELLTKGGYGSVGPPCLSLLHASLDRALHVRRQAGDPQMLGILPEGAVRCMRSSV
jgi:hypothetical protein